ncbi:hypothetical protein ACRRTK_019075 [Alexandromys fortis]
MGSLSWHGSEVGCLMGWPLYAPISPEHLAGRTDESISSISFMLHLSSPLLWLFQLVHTTYLKMIIIALFYQVYNVWLECQVRHGNRHSASIVKS